MKINKVHIPQYYDWWFDSAIEFLGHLLETVAGVNVEWGDGISFEELDTSKVRMIVDEIETLIDHKLKYQNPKTKEIKWRHYLPLTASNSRGDYKNKYLSGFLGLAPQDKQKALTGLLRKNIISKHNSYCDICSANVAELTELTQGVYPSSNNQINSLNGLRFLRQGKICIQCQVLGYLNWLDKIPFVWKEDIRNKNNKVDTHILLYPKIENLTILHSYKKIIRESLTEKRNSNIIVGHSDNKETKIATNHFSLLLAVFENILRQNRTIERIEGLFCKDWVALSIQKSQIRTTYCEEITIPNIKSLEHIFSEIKEPYSGFVDKTFAAEIKEGVSKEVKKSLTEENKYFISQGLLLDNFHTFSKAFQIRQNCGIAFPKDAKEIFERLIILWRCGK